MAKTKKEKKEKKAGKRMKKKELVKALLDFFHIKQDEVLSLKYIFEQLHLTTHPLKMLCMDILSELSDDDYITEVDKHKYKLNNHGVEMTGIFQRKSNGKNSFIPEGGGDPIFVAERNSAHAMAGDKVRIAFYAKRRGREAEGEVIEILERANDTFVGTLEVAKSYAFLVTENRTLANDIFIPKEKLKGGKTGDKAIVKVVEWPDKAKNPIGQVIDILGKAGDNTTEMHAILAEFGLPYVYPASVEKAADKIPAEIPAEEYAKREDFRNITTLTIDPKDAKDFDDALSVRKLKDNLWEVGVHIADVTHYVTEDSIIDKEAEKRATSVYLVDRTIPMLPERLCNFICSLRPNEEKLAYSAIFEMTDKGEIKNSRIVHTVIKSDRRFTYEEAQQIIETKEGDFKEEILKLDALAKILREKRFAAGAINFDRYEVKFEIDEKGKPISVYFKESKDANKLAIMTLNRHQDRFDLYFADPRSTLCKLVLRDESPYYIKENIFDNIEFYPEYFSLLSERDGYSHLYWYSMGGNLIKKVTNGKYEVKDFLGYDEEDGSFYYTSNEESPLRKAVYKIDKKGKKTKLSQKSGTNTPLFSKSMKYYMNKFTSLDTPMLVTLNDNSGKTLKTLVTNDKLKQTLSGYAVPQKEFFTFQTTDGVTLNGWMMKPVNFSASKKYPVLMYQYSGPGSQQVLDTWGISWETYMASLGYIVVCVDGRGTGGRGEVFEKCTYLKIGVKEARDQVETALYLGKQAYVDKDRIGIWGWSYGGYMTLMSMSEGTPVFKAGVAVAAPTDWRFYDTIYTERFMRTPKENAEGYKASSAFTRADKLHGNLLLVHGMADDNVHFQNCAEYAEQLVQLGKQFDMQIYTNRNHGIYGGNTRQHLYTRLTNFFLNNL